MKEINPYKQYQGRNYLYQAGGGGIFCDLIWLAVLTILSVSNILSNLY